jgi:glycosyltransferase involved in cell wall biosynthesis
MKILFLLTQDLSSPSGIGRYFPLAKELAKLGNDISILALHPNYYRLGKKQDNNSGVHVRYVAPMHVKKDGSLKSYYSPLRLIYQAILATKNLAWASWKIPVDIVHIGKPHPMNGIAGLLKGLQKNQVYVDCDDDEAGSGVFKKNYQRKIVEWFEKVVPQKADFITTNTYYTKNRLQSFNIDPNRIFYLSSGVDMDRFNPPDPFMIKDLHEKYRLSNNQVIAYIGSLSLASHPIDLLLQAFNLVLQVKPQIKLIIVGGGDAYNYLQDQVQKIGISESVIFTGHIASDEVVKYYYLSDIVVDPVLDNRAARGRQPLKLFECWACGVPYVSADVGDRSEIIGNPPAGVLAIPGDSDSLSEVIIRVLSNDRLSKEVTLFGRQRVQNFTWTKLAEKMNKEYHENYLIRE